MLLLKVCAGSGDIQSDGKEGKFQHQRRLVRVVGDAVWVDAQYVHEADERAGRGSVSSCLLVNYSCL